MGKLEELLYCLVSGPIGVCRARVTTRIYEVFTRTFLIHDTPSPSTYT